MSWETRDYGSKDTHRSGGGHGGRFNPSSWIGRLGDDPFRWAFPVARIAGIRILVHLVFVIFVLGQLARAAFPHQGSITTSLLIKAEGLGVLFVIVLLHEFGHCFFCRRVGGDANEIIMWPLGGLAVTRPPMKWRCHFLTAAGGPLVNVALAVILMPSLFLLTGSADPLWGFDPFAPGLMYSRVSTSHGYWASALWWAHYMNTILLAINLLPLYPLDGGAMLHAALWSKMSRHRATEITTALGYILAAILVVAGLAFESVILIVLAMLGFGVCWQERRRLRFLENDLDWDPVSAEDNLYGAIEANEPKKEEPALPQKDDVEVDEILERIATSGMDSLSRKERKILQQATLKRRQE